MVDTPTEDKNLPNGYKLSQHPFYRQFRESLKEGEPQYCYYIGALKNYGSKDTLPGSPARALCMNRTLAKQPEVARMVYRVVLIIESLKCGNPVL
ncbi:hypothetical protein NW755_002237 [Fusarium falciforme]|uniref:Uncharacterized protein n=1 Tax=Fusarium falciforme TaxID=195108 RepID=A0A9W8RG54_9HYPO|nr:hypothetical protein NW755_002237 [Fusarium falciforme]